METVDESSEGSEDDEERPPYLQIIKKVIYTCIYTCIYTYNV